MILELVLIIALFVLIGLQAWLHQREFRKDQERLQKKVDAIREAYQKREGDEIG